MKARNSVLALSVLLCACAPEQGDDVAPAPATATPVTAAAPSSGAASPLPPGEVAAESNSGRTARYTRLDKCRVIEATSDEGGWYSAECPGEGGYKLRLTEGDLRQNILVIPPEGKETSLAVAEATQRAGFSRLGETVEWRGEGEGKSFRPDALILRYFVIEDPEPPQRETSYLLPVALGRVAPGGQKPCIAGMVPPGPEQNERARRIADGPMKCLR